MSLDYTTLQALVLSTAVRPELTAEAPGFVRLCEGMIRREVLAHETRVTLDETDRSSAGLYTLPDTIQEIRAAYYADVLLQDVGARGIKLLSSDAPLINYAVFLGAIEFRGVPATNAEIEIVGLGWPVALATTSTNALLTNHEALYLYGSLFALYQFTQDLELAQGALSTFRDAVDKVNRLFSRNTGGAQVLPAYNFGHTRIGRGY